MRVGSMAPVLVDPKQHHGQHAREHANVLDDQQAVGVFDEGRSSVFRPLVWEETALGHAAAGTVKI
jgi:hypothetical protein